MINIPRDNQFAWSQPNVSDLFGNIFITKNITFDTQGYLRLSYSPRVAMDETVDADFNNPAAILWNPEYDYFVATWDEPFEANEQLLLVRPVQIVDANHPNGSLRADATWFGGFMPVTETTDVHYWDEGGGSWVDTNISLTGGGQHPLVNFLSLSALAVANVNTVLLYSYPLTATPTLITTLTIGAEFEITAMCYFNQNLYIATQNVNGGHAFMYVWNGLGTAAQQVYEVDSNMIFNICAHQYSVVLLSGNGSLLRFNGGGFDLLAGFPIFYQDQALNGESSIEMYHNTIKSNGNLLYILFSNQVNNDYRMLSMPDGLWCYDERVGLYHRYALSISLTGLETVLTTEVNTTTNQITTSGDYKTGIEVYYNADASTIIGGLKDNTKYFVIRIDATHIQLATTKANALAGIPIDLTGTGNNSQRLVFYPNVDYGQYFTEKPTALAVIERPTDEQQYGTDVIWGYQAVLRANAAADQGALGTVSNGVESRGYFVTPKIFSDNVTDNYDLLTVKFSPFTSELDKIIIKYRTVDDMREFINVDSNIATNWEIAWTSTTTFTTVQSEWSNAVVGNEVEILMGAGGGLLAHITAISEAGGTYTVTLDDTYDLYTSGDEAQAVFRNWTKFKTIVYGDSNAEQFFLSEHLGVAGKWIQLKIELRGIRTRIEEVLLDNVYRLPAADK